MVTGTNPDPFYEEAGTAMYLGLTLNPVTFAEIHRFDKERVREFFRKENSFIIHPIRVRAFRRMVLDQCDEGKNGLTFKREVVRTQDEDSDTEMDIYEDYDTLSVNSSDEERMDC